MFSDDHVKRQTKTKQIAVLVNHLGNPFEASLVTFVESALAERDYSMLLHTYHQETSEDLLAALAERIDGLLLIGQTLQDTTIERYVALGIPIVSLLKPAWQKQAISYIDLDWIKAMRRTIEYLLSQGHEEIGFMTNGHPAHYHTQRFSSFIQAMQLCKVKFEHSNVLHGGGTYLKAFDAMEGRIATGALPFSALVCANDLMAIGVIAACRHYGIHIPGQLAIIGCEDILMTTETNPPLTTIQYAREVMCRAAVDQLFAKMNGEEVSSPEVEGFLLIRSSA